MGKSRSAAFLIAYLLYTDPIHTPSTALALIRQSRPFAEPNSGFMRQLELYHSMHCPTDLDAEPGYQRWLYQRTIEASNAAGVAPDTSDIRFGDERAAKPPNDSPNKDTTSAPSNVSTGPQAEQPKAFRCRRCRHPLGTSAHLTPHNPNPQNKSRPPNQECAHLFIEPLSWMRPELEKGKLEGRLECPNAKCRTQVGRYAWQGMKCSCEGWAVPAVSLAKGKVDEVVDRGGAKEVCGGGDKGRM